MRHVSLPTLRLVDAAFMSRNILFKEVHDESLESNLRVMNNSNNQQVNLPLINLFPNPSNSILNINLNNLPFIGNIMVYDNFYRIVQCNHSINGTINTLKLIPGQYILKLMKEEGEVIWSKFHVIH